MVITRVSSNRPLSATSSKFECGRTQKDSSSQASQSHADCKKEFNASVNLKKASLEIERNMIPTTLPLKINQDHAKNEKEEKSTYFIHHKYYTDRSEDIPEIAPLQKRSRGGAVIPFPLRLHQMLDDVENAELTSLISWRMHGRALIVHKRDEFVSKVLPIYFCHKNFASFQRQLNLYGFSRISRGKDKGAYYHESFLRGRYLLSSQVIRTKVKGKTTRGCSNPHAEPDFYNMAPLGTLAKETLSKIYDLKSNLINEHMSRVLDEEIIKLFARMKKNCGSHDFVLCSEKGQIEIPVRIPYLIPSGGERA